MNTRNNINRLGLLLIISIALFMSSCEDVIEVELDTEEPRLIVDALIRVDTSEALTKVIVKVSETRSFFESVPPADLQQITLSNLSDPGGGIDPPVLLEEVPGSGIYSKVFATDYLTEGSLLLQIDYKDELYVAMTEFVPAVPIDKLEQGDGFLVDEGDIEVILTFTDNGDRDDFYLFDFSFGNYVVGEDEFYQGQQFEFSYFYDDEVSPGDSVEVSIMGVDEDFHRYMGELITQSGDDFGPFATPSITVRGNFINATDIDNINNFDNLEALDNFALGYFAVVQEFKETIVIE